MALVHDPIDPQLRAALSEYDDLAAALLARRGIATAEDAQAFLRPSYDEHLHDPLLLKNMPAAASRVAQAIVRGERIAVWSDYDCDGIPGAVVLHDFLKKVGANFENYIPHRHAEGYGVNKAGVTALHKRGATLMITVDSGITDTEAIAHARALGMEVIVTDHHIPGATLPDAIVVDHKQSGETYPFPELCGAALAWKLVCAVLALDEDIRARAPKGFEKWLLDMVGLATIADMVPLLGENRVLATYGLIVLRKSPRLGLQKLCRAARVNQRFLTEEDVGFSLAPRVNAAGRMGDPKDAFQLFITADESEADALSKKLEAANRSRRAAAGAITRAVHERLEARVSDALPSVIALGDPEWKPSLLGLVASGIAEHYERPVFLWGREGSGVTKGSCRSYGGVHLVELMTAAGETFVEFGGHALAGGFTLRDEHIFSFEDRMTEARATLILSEQTEAVCADAAVSLEDITNTFHEKLSRFAPFGEQNPKPVFAFQKIEAREVSWFGKENEHLKLRVPQGKGTIDAIAFYAKRTLGKEVECLAAGTVLSFSGTIERDQFTKGRPLRIRITALL